MAAGGPGGPSPRRRTGVVLAVALVAVFGVVLLWPDGDMVNRAVVRLYVVLLDRGMPASVTPEVYGVLLNIALFVPLGWAGVGLLRWPPLRVVGGLVALSATVELVQALPFVGRDASVGDVACNALGAVVGVALGSLVRRRGRPGDGAAGDEHGPDQPVDEPGDVGRDRLER